jgi:hypothetical protein
LGDDFFRGSFADGASGIPDAALRERELAATSAGIGIKAVKRNLFLLGCELREVDAGKFGSPVSV